MKKAFLGTFWVLLIFGILQLIVDIFNWMSFCAGSMALERSGLLVVFALRLFMWPMIVLGEALVYWLIRWRNRYRALSWAHVGILIAAFLINLAIALFRMSSRREHDLDHRISDQIYRREQVYFFWAMAAVAHLAFFAVLANCARKEQPEDAGLESGNLLDDIEL